MKAYLPLVALVSLLLSGTCHATALPTISFSPPFQAVTQGQTFSLDVVGNGFPATEGGGVDISFDASIVHVLGVTLDPVWTFTLANSVGTIDNVAGTVSNISVGALPGVPTGSFTVATVEFQAMGLGSTMLSMTEPSNNPWGSGGSAIGVSFDPGTVSVVPIPAALWMFGSGLIGLAGIGRRPQ